MGRRSMRQAGMRILLSLALHPTPASIDRRFDDGIPPRADNRRSTRTALT